MSHQQEQRYHFRLHQSIGTIPNDLTKESNSSKKGESLKDELTTLVDLGVDLLVIDRQAMKWNYVKISMSLG